MNAVSNQTRESENKTRKVSFDRKDQNFLGMLLIEVPYNGSKRNVLAVKKAGYPDSNDVSVNSRHTVVWAVKDGKVEITRDEVWCNVSPIDEVAIKEAVIDKLKGEDCRGPYIFE